MTIEENYVAMAQELAAAKLNLRMAMKLLKKARPLATGDAGDVWMMQLEGLLEEVGV